MNKTQCERLLQRLEAGQVDPMGSAMVSKYSGSTPRRDTNSIDLVGHVCNYLTVIEKTELRYGSSVLWRCKCVCGREDFLAKAYWLKNLKIKSCGCMTKSILSSARTTHGMTDTPTWTSWKSMLDRCYCKSHKSFSYYGGRGITVCDSWKSSFEAFFKDMGERPEGKSLDRVDNSNGYSPNNCRWATPQEQACNTRSNRFLVINGERNTVSQWCAISGIGQDTASGRLDDGWSDFDAVFKPVKVQKNNRNRFGESCHVAQYSLGGV